MTGLQILQQCAWEATFILMAAFAAGWTLRSAPAAWRHFLWTAVLGGLLLLPAMVRVMPKWGLETTPRMAASAPVSATMLSEAPIKEPVPARGNPLLLVWLTGCTLAALRFLAGRVRISRMVRQATEARFALDLMDAAGGHGVRVLQSPAAQTALAAGIWRPAVVLPGDAGEWPVERLRAALLHEFMHVRRRDLAAQAIAQAACCLYWFHPLAWMSALQLRREREQACDDAVLGHGMNAHEYAGHLVESVRALRGKKARAMAMAEPSLLEVRVRALLDSGRDRRPLNRAAACAVVGAMSLILLPLTSLTVHAQVDPVPPIVLQPAHGWVPVALDATPPQTPKRRIAAAPTSALARAEAPAPQTTATPSGFGSLSGLVQDPSGARVPNCTVTVKNEDGSHEETTSTDAVGAYQFASLPEGKYTLQAMVRGFKIWSRAALPVQGNQASTVNLNLEVGSVSETVTITAARPATIAAPTTTAAPPAIRVGGMVQPAMLLKRVPPVYPEDLRAQGISGTVHLVAIISKQGTLTEIRTLSSPAPGLTTAAMEAASRWQYQPSTLNGEPIQVMTNIDIAFELK